MRRARSLRLIAGVTAAAIALAACGNSSTAATTSSTSSASPPARPPATRPPAAPARAAAPPAAGGRSPARAAPRSPPSRASESAAAAGGGTALQVGLAFDTGGRGDGTFNDSAANGADRAKSDLGVTVTELEANSDDDRVPNMNTLTQNKNNPIIAVGFLWTDTVAAAAAAQPGPDLRDHRLRRRRAERQEPRLRRGAGLVPRRCGRRAEEHDLQDRLHRWPGGRADQALRGRLQRRRQGRRAGHRDRVPVPGRRG